MRFVLLYFLLFLFFDDFFYYLSTDKDLMPSLCPELKLFKFQDLKKMQNKMILRKMS